MEEEKLNNVTGNDAVDNTDYIAAIKELKENRPDILDHDKVVDSCKDIYSNTLQIIRFSSKKFEFRKSIEYILSII